jgi:hypothetical protein
VPLPRLIGRALRLAALATSACAFTAILPAGAGAASLSSNWAGYVAAPTASSGVGFSRVSGRWTQPSAKCAGRGAGYSAVWVGLGGYRESAHTLEQVGTDADCTGSGRARYSSWYELLPAAPVVLSLKIRPGDRLNASVTTRGRSVTLRIRNLTTNRRFAVTRRLSRVDVSTAEWIVEAPSECTSSSCRTLPLADFGVVSFTSATATAHGHTGTLGDPRWSAGALELRQSPFAAGRPGVAGSSASAVFVGATPTAAARASGAFSVSWGLLTAPSEAVAPPTLPGGSEPSA